MAIGRPRTNKRTNGAITLRKDGRKSPWMYRYWVGGTRKTGYAKTRAIAEQKLNRVLVLSADGLMSADDLTFAEWSDFWLSSKRSIRERTRKQYEFNIARAIGFFGQVRLSKLGPGHLESMYGSLLDSGLSPTTVHSLHVIVGNCLRAAHHKGFVGRDIKGMADAPSAQKRKPVILSRKQWKLLIDESAKSPAGLVVEYTLKTGQRINVEALSTLWAQIDFENHCVTVSASKTAAGEGRVIPLDAALVSRLKSLQAAHSEKQLATKGKWNRTDLVFCTANGNRQSYQNLQRRVLEPMLVRVGLPRLSWHHLRYNCGSYLLSEGVPIPTVSKILGHAHPGITLSIYARELEEDSEQVRTAMARFA